MKKHVSPFVAAFALATVLLTPRSHVTLGTHMPKSSHNVWQVIIKNGYVGTAFPVAKVDETTYLFLTAKHAMRHNVEAIVQTSDKLTKYPILKHVDHPTADVSIITVKVTKPVKLMPLDLEHAVEPGMCLFNVGYPSPTLIWSGFRGWATSSGVSSTAFVRPGMSGGPVITPNSGKAVGVIEGFPYRVYTQTVTSEGKKVGEFPMTIWFPEQSYFTPLFPYKVWLRSKGVE